MPARLLATLVTLVAALVLGTAMAAPADAHVVGAAPAQVCATCW